MRTKGRGAPAPDTPWNEIIPNLWIGGHHYRDLDGQPVPAVVSDEFDVVISLIGQADRGPSATVEHRWIDIPDGPLRPEQLAAVAELATVAANSVRADRSVLVRCWSGYNRSGLVVAESLAQLGYSIDDAVSLIRRHRSQWALNNPLFVDYLNTGLDVAQLLTGLDA